MTTGIITYDSRFPELGQFLGGFFHQDWKDVLDWQEQQPNFEEVVRFYKTQALPTEVVNATEQLRQFLKLPMGEQEFNEVVTYEFGGSYTPRSRGLTKRQWLEAVLKVLEEPTQPSQLRFVG